LNVPPFCVVLVCFVVNLVERPFVVPVCVGKEVVVVTVGFIDEDGVVVGLAVVVIVVVTILCVVFGVGVVGGSKVMF